MVDKAGAQRWLDKYASAWETYDPAAIGALFAKDAEYRWHPWDEGDRIASGREAIVAAWLGNKDAPGTYVGEYRPLLVHDNTVVAVGTSRYYADPTRRKLVRAYHNLWIIEFDDKGRCSAFTEWYMKSPKAK